MSAYDLKNKKECGTISIHLKNFYAEITGNPYFESFQQTQCKNPVEYLIRASTG
jgi:hypothetical protein